MKITEIKSGEIFCIGGTKSYPKLKLDIGYTDMRDEIVKRDEASMTQFECEIMTEDEIANEFKKYGMTPEDARELKTYLCIKYN